MLQKSFIFAFVHPDRGNEITLTSFCVQWNSFNIIYRSRFIQICFASTRDNAYIEKITIRNLE